MTLQALLAQALALSPQERGLLASQILARLDEEGAPVSSGDLERSWAEEIRHRLAGIAAGTATFIPGEQVFAELELTCG